MSKKMKQQKLGLWMLTALVTGNMIGSGIFLLPASLAAYGSISLLSWIATAAGALLIALVFAKLANVMPLIGGPYAYCREAFGDFVGFQMAYNYWIALWVGNAAIVVALTGYLSFFWPLLAKNALWSCLVSISLVWLMTFINILGVRHAGIFQLLTTILKLIPLLLIAFVGIFYIHPHFLSAFNLSGKSNLSAFSGAATLTLWSFIGLESASVPADHVDNPNHTIPKATILGVIIATVVYILSSITVMGVMPLTELAHSNAPYADAARVIFGPIGSTVVAIGAVISCVGALNGWILLQGQIPLAAAQDKLFPSIFLKKSENGTPVVGLIISSVLISLLLLMTLNHSLVKQFTIIILLATLASLIPYFLTTMSELVIFLKYPGLFKKGRKLFGSVIIAVLAGIYSFWVIIGSGKETVFYGTLLLLSSAPVYVWMKWRSSSNIGVINGKQPLPLP
ncbi:amino acid permease [Candidatus Rickettsiella isopodorum]|jgi:APA family basic amino acid/polyamine antiporter|uniref:Arginine/agmatine antiporter n=1 Tax=Candidatus Rickettsiella isopodorum TaxID=1225476 RepID=A0A1J8NG84_9COXI|nr:amino acid permease [Candidatus Rickettsiella isopodorum]OIZ94337.1 amino acid permease [Candidatus Rickettsiella isopodorum]